MKNAIIILAMGAATGLLSQAAYAQQGAPIEAERSGGELEEIVVMGTRRQIRTGISSKMNATGVADFIAADEFGTQPDLNLADSLRRLPGVSTEFDEDEGRFVSVRGLPSRYSTVALNGLLVPNGWGSMSRKQNIEALPSFAVRRSGVYKSLTSDIDGNAIGGYINNEIVSAFDRDDFYLATDFRLGTHSYLDTPGGDGDPSPKLQFLVSDLFGADEQFGVVLAAHYFEKNRDQSKSLRRHQTRTDVARGYRVNRLEALDYSNSITRWSVLGKLEYQTDNVRTAISATRFDYQYDEARYFTRIDGRGTFTETAEGGTWENGRAELILDRYPIGTTTDTLMWDLTFDTDNGGRLDLAAAVGTAEYELFEDASSVNFRSGDLPGLGFSYDVTGQSASDARLAPVVFNDASVLLDTTQYSFVGDFWPRADEQGQDVTQFKADYGQGMSDQGFGFKVGASWRRFESFVDNNRADFYDPVDDATFPKADAFVANTTFNPGLGIVHPLIDPNLFLNYFYDNPNEFKNNVAKGESDVVKADLEYDEDIVAAYAMAKFSGDNYKITGGLRYETTDWNSVGVNNSLNNEKVFRADDYDHALLSLVGHYDISDTTRLRYGFHQSIGRPEPSDLARRETLSEDPGEVRVSRGNPDLQPREADNYDLALEYAFGDGEFFSVGYFYKDLKNEIFTSRNEADGVDSNGDPVIIITTEPTNLSEASVQGWELTLVNDQFESLPYPFDGFGFTSNFTYLDADLDVPMDVDDPSITRNISLLNGSPRWKLNAAILFEQGPVEAKLTHAYRDDTRRSTSTSREGDDLFEEAYSQWDIFARYTFNDQWRAFVEGRNITDEVRVFSNGNGLFKERNEFGKSWWVGVSYRH